MKIQIDTESKVIKVEDKVNLKDLYKQLQKLFPNKEWEAYDLETNVTIYNWSNPVVIKEYPIGINPYIPVYPWWQQPTITCGDNNGTVGDISHKTMTYCVEVN